MALPKQLPGSIVFLACLAPLTAQQPPSLPPWLAPFPGVTEHVKSSPTLAESIYLAPASVDEVLAHYRKLFDAARLPFYPSRVGLGTTIQGAVPGCGLTIMLRKQFDQGTAVHVTCSSKPGPYHSAAADTGLRSMEKFDQPVYPRPRAALPALVWPTWLVHCDGRSLEVYKGVDRFKLNYLKAEFTSQSDRSAIQAFYTDLLNSHSYGVTMARSRITPPDRQAVVVGAHFFDTNPGPQFAIRVEMTPVDGAIHVELRVTARP